VGIAHQKPGWIRRLASRSFNAGGGATRPWVMSYPRMKLHRDSFQTDRREEPCTRHPVFEKDGRMRLPAWLILLFFALSIRIISIWNCELSGPDEPRVAGIAREMAITGNYFIPRLNGEDFLEYPPLGYLPIVLSLSASEKPSDFLAFFPIALIGTGTILLTFLIGRALAGERVGLTAGFILSMMSGFFILHRRCLVDPMLLFFITLSLYGFVKGHQCTRKSSHFLAIFYLAMAGGFLSKGLIGLGIPAVTAAAFLIWSKDFSGIRKLRLGWGILLFLLPISLWAGGVWWLEGPGHLEEIIWQSLWRFFSSSADHAHPFYFYLIPTFLNLLPWTPLPLILLWKRYGSSREKELSSEDLLAIFALSWLLSAFIGLSLASAKRVLYLGPVFPPFALLSALAWDRIREKFPEVKRREVPGLIALFVIFIGIHFFQLLPSERQDSLRPVFRVVANKSDHGPIRLCNPSEAIRGAAFFYLGKRIPMLKNQELSVENFENSFGETLVINLFGMNDQLRGTLEAKGFRLLMQEKIGKMWVLVYSNSS